MVKISPDSNELLLLMNLKTNLLVICIAFLVLLYYMTVPAPFDSTLFLLCAVIGVCGLIIFSKSVGIKGYWIKPSVLFLIGFLAVNIQYIIDFYLGLKTSDSTMIRNTYVLNQCMILGIIGLLAFILGYYNNRRTYRFLLNKINHTTSCNNSVPIFFVAMNVTFFILFIATINVFDFLSGASFADDTKQSPFESLLYLSNMLVVVYASLAYDGRSRLLDYLKSYPKVSIAIILLYMALRMFSGDRGPFIYTAFLLIYGYLYSTRRRWSLIFVVGIVFISSLFISLIGIARQDDLNISFWDRIASSYTVYSSGGRFGASGEKSICSATEELGFSFLVNQTDVEAVEINNEPFHYGMYQVYSLLVAIPYMPSFLEEKMGIPKENLSSVGFANKHFFGTEDNTWSIGTTLIGDFYLDFGVLGVVLGLFITGLFFRYIESILFIIPHKRVSAFALFLALHFSSQAIYMPRSVLLLNLQKVLLGFILIYIYNLIKRKY